MGLILVIAVCTIKVVNWVLDIPETPDIEGVAVIEVPDLEGVNLTTMVDDVLIIYNGGYGAEQEAQVLLDTMAVMMATAQIVQ